MRKSLMTVQIAWGNCNTVADIIHQSVNLYNDCLLKEEYMVKMRDKFHRNEDNGMKQTPRHWCCDCIRSLMSM